jgi:streptomycin 6-kinase
MHSQLVAPARLADGTEAVLKVQLPGDFEAEHEAEALRFWDGKGAVRLLEHDPERRALLIERCRPGTPLGDQYDDADVEVAATLMGRLWRTAPPEVAWRRIDREAERWLGELPQRYGGRLLEEAIDAIPKLVATQAELVLCHQDLHGGNILRAEREPWLAIDAKPILAEPAYDTVALIRDARPSLDQLRRRLDLLSGLLGLDRERMRLWGLVKSLAWDDAEQAALFSKVGSRR